MLAKDELFITFSILVLATLAAFFPLIVLAIIAGVLFASITFHFPVFGIIVATLATLLGEFGRVEVLGSSALALDLIIPLVLISWLARKLIRKESIPLDRVSGTLLAFFLLAILSLIIGSTDLASSELKFAALHLLRFIAIAGLYLVARDVTKASSEKIVGGLLLTGVLLAVAGFTLLQMLPDFTEAGLTDLGWDPHIGRLASTWFDPNFVAGALAFLLPLAGAYFLSSKKVSRQVSLLLVAGVLLAALLLTYSRSGLLALGIGGIILGLIKSRRLLIAMLVMAVIGIAASPRLSERVVELGRSVTSLSGESQQVLDPTAQLRADSWQEGLRVWQANPILGTGFGAYKFHQGFISEDSHAATGTDASLLNVAATTGTVGLLLFLIFLVNLGRNAWIQRKDPAALSFLAAGSGLLIHSIFVNSLFFPPLALYFFVTAGLATRFESTRKES